MEEQSNVIAAFSSAKKQHWRSGKLHGSRTACNRRTSGPNSNETDHYSFWVNKYPEDCCVVCLTKYKEKFNK